MTYYDQAKGQNPTGFSVPIPVGGQVFEYDTNPPRNQAPLGSNQSLTTGWIDTTGYGSLIYIIRTDVESASTGVLIEYSDDGVNAFPAGLAFPYTQLNQQIQRVLNPKRKYTRITYLNGPSAQTTFWMEVKLSTTLVQPTESSVNVPVSDTNLALITKGPIEAKETDTGGYAAVYRTGNALNVNVVNQTAPTTNQNVNVTNTVLPLPTGAASSALQTSGNSSLSSIDGKTPGLGQKTMASSSPVVIASDQSSVSIRPPATSTATVSRVTTISSTSGVILAANASRKGFSISSEGTLYVLFGTGTASPTNYTVRIVANGYYEPPEDLVWQGAIQGVGAVCQVTEFI